MLFYIKHDEKHTENSWGVFSQEKVYRFMQFVKKNVF